MEFTPGMMITMFSLVGGIGAIVGFGMTFYLFPKQRKKLLSKIEIE